MKSASNIFDAISNPTRRDMLYILRKGNKKVSDLSNDIGISMQAMEKHKTKLINAQLIQKTNNTISLTELGHGVLNQMISLEFLEKNKKLFSKYSLSYFPTEFVNRIGELHNFEKVIGYVTTIERYKQFLDETREYARIIVPQISLDIYKEGMEKLKKNNVDVFYILGTNAIIPKGWLKMQKELKEQEMISRGKLHRRMVENVHVMLYLSENNAFLALPNMEGVAEPTIMLASKDEEFRKWCHDYFNWVWRQSKTFLVSKVNET